MFIFYEFQLRKYKINGIKIVKYWYWYILRRYFRLWLCKISSIIKKKVKFCWK